MIRDSSELFRETNDAEDFPRPKVTGSLKVKVGTPVPLENWTEYKGPITPGEYAMANKTYLALCALQDGCPVHDQVIRPDSVRAFGSIAELMDFALENMHEVRIFGVSLMSELEGGGPALFDTYRISYLQESGYSHTFHGLELLGDTHLKSLAVPPVVLARTVQSPDGSELYWETTEAFDEESPPEEFPRPKVTRPLKVKVGTPVPLGGAEPSMTGGKGVAEGLGFEVFHLRKAGNEHA